MKQKKFFEKFLQNITKIDEFNLKNIIELLESERRTFHEVLDWLSEGIIVFEKENVLFINQEALNILRIPQTDFPVTFQELEKNVFNRDLYSLILKSKESIGTLSYSAQNSGDIIEYYDLEFSGREFPTRILKICDSTSQKQLEFQLKNLESIGALNTLAAGIAHEIKNPLSAIDLHTQLIRKGIDKGMIQVPDEVLRYTQIIQEETKRLNNILNDFLISTRKRELKLSFADLNPFLKEVIGLFQPEFDLHQIKVETDFGHIHRIFFDRDYLKQAIVNLLKNAIEAIEESPQKIIRIKTKYDIGKDAILIEIMDSGAGINKKDLHKIFDPYFTTHENGTGLGLTIVYKIVKEHGGEIAVDSRSINEKFRIPKPLNTVFSIMIPANRGTKMLPKSD
jgi:nitrogen fixation/metabolism regulation signal transduction histidine kinase